MNLKVIINEKIQRDMLATGMGRVWTGKLETEFRNFTYQR